MGADAGIRPQRRSGSGKSQPVGANRRGRVTSGPRCGLWRMRHQPVVIKKRIKLKDFAPDFCGKCDKAGTKPATKTCAKRIGKLQRLFYADGRYALLLLFQGLDASGKDGAIKNVLHYVNPAGTQTANFRVPSADEKAHDYLWRVHCAVPRRGNIGIFNRSHYEAVLAERVLGEVSASECQRRYGEIIDFERMLAANGVVLLKFFLHLSKDEQAERFRARLELPHKKWKFSSADLESRRHWQEYMHAYEDVLNATSHPDARWHVVPADHKWYRDYIVARTVVKTLEGLKLKWPKPKEDLSKIRIK
jgi:PPK2 family polyphosphate:nucleotide phosphotransferase